MKRHPIAISSLAAVLAFIAAFVGCLYLGYAWVMLGACDQVTACGGSQGDSAGWALIFLAPIVLIGGLAVSMVASVCVFIGTLLWLRRSVSN
jgi:hypothetical protein